MKEMQHRQRDLQHMQQEIQQKEHELKQMHIELGINQQRTATDYGIATD